MDSAWVKRSACKGLDPIIFYPATDEEAGAAKAVCDACPVQADCLEHAISHREHNGVWGGATERERQRIIRRRRRARSLGNGTEATEHVSPTPVEADGVAVSTSVGVH